MKKILVVVGVVVVLLIAGCVVYKLVSVQQDPELASILASLDSDLRSPKEFPDTVGDYDTVWFKKIYPHIESADPSWVKIALQIHYGQIAHVGPAVGETIEMPIAMAITTNPSLVFTTMKQLPQKSFDFTSRTFVNTSAIGEVVKLCSAVQTGFDDYDAKDVLYTKMLAELSAREKSVEKVNDPNLQDLKTACLNDLRDYIRTTQNQLNALGSK